MLKKLVIIFSSLYLSISIQNSDSLFWHLQDPIIGMKIDQKLAQPLAWNFSLWDLAPRRGKSVSLAIIDSEAELDLANLKTLCEKCSKSSAEVKTFSALPLVEIFKNIRSCGGCKKAFFAHFSKNISLHHGMCTRNIICQIAPEVTITTYNIFDTYGYTSSANLFSTLSTISSECFDIVHFGCKISSQILSPKDQKTLDEQLSKLNYIVAAAGNDRAINKEESYPAKSNHVTFDVGAFSRDTSGSYSICSFSQFEAGIGPKVVAPGFDIACPITYDDHFLGFNMLAGTSVAAAIVSGLLALVISEFKSDFSYEEILTVLYQCTQKLSAQNDWQEQVLLGALDTRSALFCLHVLKEIKKILPSKYFHKHYVDLTKQTIFINKIYYSFDNSLIQKLLLDYKQKHNIQESALHSAQLIMSAFHPSMQKAQFKKIFDKKLLYLLRIIKNTAFKVQESNLEHDRIKFSLNRKK